MTSEITEDGGSFELASFVHGHHVYHTTETPRISEVLQPQQELANEYNHFTVAVLKVRKTVGHTP